MVKIAAFAVLLWVADAVVGVGCRYLLGRARGGDTGRMNYIADRMEEQLLVFGSSRAVHHYDPRILADSVGLSCYNCGQAGNGIIFCYGQYRLFRDRYVPRVIVYDVHPPFDLSEGDNERFLPWLRCFYDREGIDSIFRDVDGNKRWKERSMMVRYNEKFVYLAVDAYHPVNAYDSGYRPLEGTVAYEPKSGKGGEAGANPGPFRPDGLKLEYWRKLVSDCKARGTRLVFAVSPLYVPSGSMPEYEPLRRLARREGIPFLSHAGDSAFVGKSRYFKDSQHLNREGVEAYTRIVASELKELLKEGN